MDTDSTATSVADFSQQFPTEFEQFRRLFVGGAQAHGEWDPASQDCKTVRSRATAADYRDHLSGVRGLGLVPVDENGQSRFGAIDVDDYAIDHRAISADVSRRRLPLNVCRSKSGGAHLICFIERAIDAQLLIGVLKRWATVLGFPRAEVFPKQPRTTDKNLGNWINLPYFDAAHTVRYGVGDAGALTLTEFVQQARVWNGDLAAIGDTSTTAAPDDERPEGTLPRLRPGVNLPEVLKSRGLRFYAREVDDGVSYDYHGIGGQPCLIQGSVHRDHAREPRQSRFVVTKDNCVYHQCFDSDCQAQQDKTGRALRALGVDVHDVIVDDVGVGLADDDLALRFTETYAQDLRYTAQWGRWSRWTGARWSRDDTLEAFDIARSVVRAAANEVTKPSERRRITSAPTVAAVERLARADRRHAAVVELWDADAWALNTPTGTVDLRTGKLLPHRREQYLTKMTAVGPSDDDCPLWLGFLERVTNGDRELQAFLQRMCGYALTGSTREEALFFCYGTGANGKSKFLGALTGALGEYATTAPIETFVTSTGDRHPTELAGLVGVRLVTAIEVDEGRYWAESKIKVMTGGDPIAARFMRQDFFTYVPQFKLVVAANQRPSLRTVDEAIRRRFHLIPFSVTIPEKERDLQLAEKLRAEWPAILRWAIEGCVEWQRVGLAPPDVVRAATAEYLTDEDQVALWIEDRCFVGAPYDAKTSELFNSWSKWCEERNQKPGQLRRLSDKLVARGFERAKVRNSRGFLGIGLRDEREGISEGSQSRLEYEQEEQGSL